MKIKEIIVEDITTDIDNVDEELEHIRQTQEELDSDSIHNDDEERYKEIDKEYKAYEAIAFILKNYKRALADPELMKGSYFYFSIDDYLVAAVQGRLDGNILELKWLGSISPGEGKKLLNKVISSAKGHGATKATLSAKWGSDEYHTRYGFKQAKDSRSNPLADIGGDYEKEI